MTSQRQCGRKSGGVAEGKQFRSLVVVPRSHKDGTFEQLCRNSSTGQVQVKDPKVAARAVQLDLRPTLKQSHESLFVAWDSHVVHQGHTHVVGGSGWNPPLQVPKFFSAEDASWKQFLAEEGYVVISDILSHEDVQEALRLLLVDLKLLEPGLRSLDEVRESHLPSSGAANDLRMEGGLCHGGFAWFLRCRPQVTRLFEKLFGLPPGAPLVGSVDVVALAPPDACPTSGKQWLHLDYSPPQGKIWQACLQLFPRTAATGARWERIAVMVCKAPATWAFRAEHALLACCVTGAASRATAGVTLGKLHKQSKARDKRRLLPKLAEAPLAAACAGDLRSDSATDFDRIRWLAPQEVMRLFSAEELRCLLSPATACYVSPTRGGLQQGLERQLCDISRVRCSLARSTSSATSNGQPEPSCLRGLQSKKPIVRLTPGGQLRADLGGPSESGLGAKALLKRCRQGESLSVDDKTLQRRCNGEAAKRRKVSRPTLSSAAPAP